MKALKDKLVTLYLRDLTEEQGKIKVLKMIEELGYKPIDIVWRTKSNRADFLCDDLECYFNIDK